MRKFTLSQLNNSLEDMLTEWSISSALKENPLTINELADRTFHSKRTLYKHLNRLIKAKFVSANSVLMPCPNGESRQYTVYSLKSPIVRVRHFTKWEFGRLEKNLRKEGFSWECSKESQKLTKSGSLIIAF